MASIEGIRIIYTDAPSREVLEELETLLNECYPLPPRDVFDQVIRSLKSRKKAWLAYKKQELVGMVMLSPHSKGGHLENLAVKPKFQKEGIGTILVKSLIKVFQI